MRRTSFLVKIAKILTTRPLVVGTLTGQGDFRKQMRSARTSGLDLLEVRLDTFALPSRTAEAVRFAQDLLSQIKKSPRLPILLTLRSFKEAGGQISVRKRFDDFWRWAVLKELIPWVQVVDVEIRSGLLSKKVSHLAHRKNVSVILSTHDFRGLRSEEH